MNDDPGPLSMNELLLYVHGAAVIQLLRSGVELNVFTILHEFRHLTLGELNAHIRIDEQSIRTLFMGLAALRLVHKEGDQYANSPVIDRLIERGEWEVFKSLVMFQAYIVYPGQIDYFESLIAGQNVGIRRYPGEGHTLYEKFRFDPRTKHIFYLYMNKYSDYANPEVLAKVDFGSSRRVLDVGGGGGSNAIALAAKYPQMEVTILDLPAAQHICEEQIDRHGLCERIKFHPCDIFKDGFPRGFDDVLFFHELMIWDHSQIRYLLKEAHESLGKTGRVIIFGSVSNDSEDGPLMAALDTVYFRSVAAGRGMIYPWKDYESILLDVGFRQVSRIRCETWTPHGIIVGHMQSA
jgi:SAM-dependent methyltransferase